MKKIDIKKIIMCKQQPFTASDCVTRAAVACALNNPILTISEIITLMCDASGADFNDVEIRGDFTLSFVSHGKLHNGRKHFETLQDAHAAAVDYFDRAEQVFCFLHFDVLGVKQQPVEIHRYF